MRFIRSPSFPVATGELDKPRVESGEEIYDWKPMVMSRFKVMGNACKVSTRPRLRMFWFTSASSHPAALHRNGNTLVSMWRASVCHPESWLGAIQTLRHSNGKKSRLDHTTDPCHHTLGLIERPSAAISAPIPGSTRLRVPGMIHPRALHERA